MSTTLYIIKEQDAYRFGWPPVVRLLEPEFMSRTWIRRVTVDLPDGFSEGVGQFDEPVIVRGDEAYELGTNKDEEPVIIDHTENGAFIPLPIFSEGWD